MFRLTKHSTLLSDGSKVFSVRIQDTDGGGITMTLDAMSERDADQCLEKLAGAMTTHTVDIVSFA